MMTEERALLMGLDAAVDGDMLPLLVYADWLDEQERMLEAEGARLLGMSVKVPGSIGWWYGLYHDQHERCLPQKWFGAPWHKSILFKSDPTGIVSDHSRRTKFYLLAIHFYAKTITPEARVACMAELCQVTTEVATA